MGKPNIKTIGVLTSGGDAPAMNAAVRAVARIGKERGLKVKGIRKGYNGLLNEDAGADATWQSPGRPEFPPRG